MNDTAPDDRPREKLERHGAGALGDNELLAILIGHGTSGKSALTLANQLLQVGGGLHGLIRVHWRRLATVPGIGVAQASRVHAALELGRRSVVASEQPRPRFSSPREAALFLLAQYGSHAVERFGVMLLDTRLRLVSVRIVSVGSLDSSAAHPREVFREAVTAGAAVVVVFHNHPSGDPTPSRDDILLTQRLKQAGAVIGIELVDHVILADAKYCSLREARLL